MRKTAQDASPGGPADTAPGQDAVHPYSYDEEPSCSNCKKPMVLVTNPYSPAIVFNCPDCNTKIDVTGPSRVEPGTGNTETGEEHVQTFEGLLDKGANMEPEFDPKLDKFVDLAISSLAEHGDDVGRVMDMLLSTHGGEMNEESWSEVERQLNEFFEPEEVEANNFADPSHVPYNTSGRAPENMHAEDIRKNVNMYVQNMSNTPTAGMKDSLLKKIEASESDIKSMAMDVLMTAQGNKAIHVMSKSERPQADSSVIDLLASATANYIMKKPELDFIMVFEDILQEVVAMSEKEAFERVSLAAFKKEAVGKDQPFTLMVKQEWDLKNEIAKLVYGLSYFQLLSGQKQRIDTAFRSFYDSHSTFSSMIKKMPALVAALKVQAKDPRVLEKTAEPRRTVEDLPKNQPKQPAQSQGQRLQKRLESAASIVEDYLVTVRMIDLQIDDYRQKLEDRLRVAKLEAEAETVEPVIKQMLRALKQHEATVKGVSFKLRESATRTDVVNGQSVEALLAKIQKLVKNDALPRFEKLAKEFYKETEVAESFRWNLTTEQEERIPKEIPPESYEEVSPEKARSLQDVRRKVKQSLTVESKDFKQMLADFWNSVKSFVFQSIQPFLGFLEGAQDEFEIIQQEIEAL
jgi:hypothetical protein